MVENLNAFEDLMKNVFKMYDDTLQPFIGTEIIEEDQKFLKELEAKTKALTLARRTGNYSKLMAVTVKEEKLSEVRNSKKTSDMEMPAPTKLPPKKRVKKEKMSTIEKTSIENVCRSSDVILQEPVISTIDLSESCDENLNARALRSSAKTATSSDSNINVSNATEYEDAVSDISKPTINSTFVLMKEPKVIKSEKMALKSKPLLDETVVIQKPTINHQLLNSEENLLTEDESMEEACPVEKSSPVKKQIQAFESKKQAEAQTSSKTNTSLTLKQIGQNKGNVKEKALGFMPTSKSKLPKKADTPQKLVKTPSSAKNVWSASKDKFDKKNEELSAIKKKKYEETYLKAKQIKEKEKEKAMRLNQLKEERHKMLLQQKAEENKLMKEENEKRRLLAKQKAEELKKREMATKTPSEQPSKPIYMLKSPPLLPCSDCYDSDEEEGNHRPNLPRWAQKPFITKEDFKQECLIHKIKNTLFCCQSRNVDLKELFGHVDSRKLKRTSSAYWEKPPRFTMLTGSSFD